MRARELAADAAQIVAVEKVGVAVFAQGEDQLADAFGAGDVERNRRGPAEIEVVNIEIPPVRRSEIIAARDRAGKVGTEADRFAVAPFFGEHSVAGRGEQRFSIAGDPALGPDAAGARARYEAHGLSRLCSRKTEDHAVIDPAIAREAAERNEDPAAEQRERAALVLHHRSKLP
jgi:hypothetical protein